MGRSANKAERLLRLEHLLLAHFEGLRRADIARRLGVHRSTVGRDVDELSRRVPIWEADNLLGINRDDYLTHVRLTVHESMALHLAARLMATRMDKHNPHAASALRKLGVALEKLAPLISSHLAASADVMDDAAQRHDPVYLEVLETLTRAWSEGRKVRLWYQKSPGEPVSEYVFAPYFVEPYAIGRTAYVIGWRDEPPGERTFKLERIRRIALLAEQYEIPNDFDARRILADAWGIWYGEGEPEKVVLRFHPRVVGRVQETQWQRLEETQTDAEGYLIWRVQVAEPREMRPWIRGWGPDCEVLAPDWLRGEIGEEMRQAAGIYQE